MWKKKEFSLVRSLKMVEGSDLRLLLLRKKRKKMKRAGQKKKRKEKALKDHEDQKITQNEQNSDYCCPKMRMNKNEDNGNPS